MKKIISLLLVLCVLFGCLTGCTTRASLYTDEYVVDQVVKHWPNVDFVSVERGFIKDYDLIDEENVEAKIYNFKNKDFSFRVYTLITEDMWGEQRKTTTDYYEKLYEFKKKEIDSVFKNSGIPTYYGYDSYTKDLNNGLTRDEFHDENPFMCSFEYPMITSSITSMTTYFYITEKEQIKTCVDLLKELYKVTEEYLPIDSDVVTEDWGSVVFWTKKEYLPDDVEFEDYWHYFSSKKWDSWNKHNINLDSLEEYVTDCYNTICERKTSSPQDNAEVLV